MERELQFPSDHRAEREFAISQANKYEFHTFFAMGNGEKKDRVVDIRMATLFDDLKNGSFWHVLGQINGYYNPYARDKETESEEKTKERQEWARSIFDEKELQDLVQLSVDIAILRRNDETGKPGTTRPHSLLHDNLISNPHSMFREMITPEFKKRLNNGRFWEELPSVGGATYHTRVAEDVLLNNFEDLDTSYVPHGLELFKLNNKYNPGHEISFRHTRKKTIKRFGQFVNAIENTRRFTKITDEDFEKLLTPYITSVFDTTINGYGEEVSIFKTDEAVGTLTQDLVYKYLESSESIRDAMAQRLRYNMHGDEENKYRAEKILKVIPNQENMLQRIEKKDSEASA